MGGLCSKMSRVFAFIVLWKLAVTYWVFAILVLGPYCPTTMVTEALKEQERSRETGVISLTQSLETDETHVGAGAHLQEDDVARHVANECRVIAQITCQEKPLYARVWISCTLREVIEAWAKTFPLNGEQNVTWIMYPPAM